MKKLPKFDSIEECEKCGFYFEDCDSGPSCEYHCESAGKETVEFMYRKCPRCKYEWKEQIKKEES